MRTRTPLAASLVVNALLLVAVVYLLKQDPGDLSSLQPLIMCTVHTRLGAVEEPVASTVSAGRPAHSLDWWVVESEDYKHYIANLRGLGCSEKTICDLITADVNEAFRTRAKARVYWTSWFRP